MRHRGPGRGEVVPVDRRVAGGALERCRDPLERVRELAHREPLDLVRTADHADRVPLGERVPVRKGHGLAPPDAGAVGKGRGLGLEPFGTERAVLRRRHGRRRRVIEPAEEPARADRAGEAGQAFAPVLERKLAVPPLLDHEHGCRELGSASILTLGKKGGYGGLHDVLAEQPDRVGHVRAERRTEDDLRDAGRLEVGALGLDHLGGARDRERVDLLVADELADRLEVELAEGGLDVRDVREVEAVARRAGARASRRR